MLLYLRRNHLIAIDEREAGVIRDQTARCIDGFEYVQALDGMEVLDMNYSKLILPKC